MSDALMFREKRFGSMLKRRRYMLLVPEICVAGYYVKNKKGFDTEDVFWSDYENVPGRIVVKYEIGDGILDVITQLSKEVDKTYKAVTNAEFDFLTSKEEVEELSGVFSKLLSYSKQSAVDLMPFLRNKDPNRFTAEFLRDMKIPLQKLTSLESALDNITDKIGICSDAEKNLIMRKEEYEKCIGHAVPELYRLVSS